jgi:hypothetical protein
MEMKIAKGFNGVLLSCKDDHSVNGTPVSYDSKGWLSAAIMKFK